MSVFRVNKNKDYVTMSKNHLKEKKMSLKAKGLLSEMLSLPEEWDYSVNGLVAINKENKSSIKSALLELKEFGYLKVTKLSPNVTTTGRYEYLYDIYEIPIKKQGIEKQGIENQPLEFLALENQALENQPQLNNNKLNNKELNNNKLNNNNSKRFKKPTLEEIQQYCKDRNNSIDYQQFYDFYETKDWMVGKNKMKDWKACVRTWERRSYKENKNYKSKIDIQRERQQKIMEDFVKGGCND